LGKITENGALPYTIKYQPYTRPRASRESPGTASKDTAADAWALVQQLMASDEKATEIKDPSGRLISLEELRDRAASEAPGA
jgi:hypothetical protein